MGYSELYEKSNFNSGNLCVPNFDRDPNSMAKNLLAS